MFSRSDVLMIAWNGPNQNGYHLGNFAWYSWPCCSDFNEASYCNDTYVFIKTLIHSGIWCMAPLKNNKKNSYTIKDNSQEGHLRSSLNLLLIYSATVWYTGGGWEQGSHLPFFDKLCTTPVDILDKSVNSKCVHS